ncbi:MAG: EVE domain-containing protein [Flavobacteriales bacterium]|nr:EVE domain-containing protein [Flavobacteriales bacterium]
MFLKDDQLAEIKVRFEHWKATSELYPKRIKQIEEFVEIGRGIVWYAAISGKLTNEMLTALIQVLRANASWTVLDKYLPVIIPKEKRLAEVRGELRLTDTRGFTGAGRNVISGLNDEQLKAVKDLLEAAEVAKTEEEAMSLVKRFEAVPMRLVKSGIFSPWLYYLNPKLFPISNQSHKGFRRKYGFPQPYSERMPGYWQLAKYLGADLGVLDAFIYSDDEFADKTEPRQYFKFSPGEQAYLWQQCLRDGVAMVGHTHLIGTDMTPLMSRAEVNKAAGLEDNDKGNKAWNLWLFRSAKPGDVLFVSKGVASCIGVGIIRDDYFFAESPEGYPHQRRVDWITDKVIDFKPLDIPGYTTLFRPDTFSPTNVWWWILKRYVEQYPELAAIFDRHDLDYEHEPVNVEPEEPLIASEPIPQYGASHWWLNANPNIWSITDTALSGRQTYTSHNDKGNKRRVYKHFQEVKPGDLLIGYESSPSKQIKGVFRVIQGLHVPSGGQEQFEFELIEKLTEPIAYEEVIRLPGLKECEPVVNNQGSLFKLTPEEFEVIRELIDSKQERVPKGVPRYDYANDPDKPFLTAAAFDDLLKQLRRKKNLVLQGPPGVGKTFIARKLAYALMKEMDDSRVEMVQFHQSTSYEDFIQGLRPAKSGGFELRNGVFYTFCQRAQANPGKDFFFIIDEINRGNLSKILGELMLLIEADKRDKKYALKLTYAEDDADTFWVPPNVHLIGTMNTADRSLAIVDYALRRRFAFVELEPDLGEPFRTFLFDHGLPDDLVQHLVTRLSEVNKHIKEDRDLGSGFQIGHSYFCGGMNGQDAQSWYNDVLAYEIRPLLQEIWFDNLDKARKMFEMLER